VSGPYTHGTGCTLAAAIAAGLARGDDLPPAVEAARAYVVGAMQHGIDVGRGHRPLGHFWRG
jgi:hydroxymethylpyrimidine/phosphomethylpyrimidine kinase